MQDLTPLPLTPLPLDPSPPPNSLIRTGDELVAQKLADTQCTPSSGKM